MSIPVTFRWGKHDYMAKNPESIPNGTIFVATDVSRMYVKLNDKILPMTPPWNAELKLKARTCIKCGATLEIAHPEIESIAVYCPYCKTSYDIDSVPNQ